MKDYKFLSGVVVGFILLAIVVGGFYGCGIAQDKQEAEKAVSAKDAIQAKPQVTPGDIVYKFTDAADMQEFEKIYAAKMAANARINVLANYIAMEKKNLENIDAQIYLKYKFSLDPAKMYNLDRDAMTITELIVSAPASSAPASEEDK